MRLNLRFHIRFGQFLLSASFLLMAMSVAAQLQIFPNRSTQENNANSFRNARTMQLPLTLPFWDDFSRSNGIYPNDSLWVQSKSVVIDDGIAINAPTIKVATFDGVDSVGLPRTQTNTTGFNDQLESRAIDLSETGLPVGDRQSLYLSFSYQWQGNGEAPDNTDYLQLQFKDTAWVDIITIYPQENFDKSVFYDTIIQVSDTRYFRKDFQFRFRNFGRQSGPFDTWNVDYVFLGANRSPDKPISFPERALASKPTRLFGGYTAIPYHQISEKDTAFIPPSFDVKNLSDLSNQSTYYDLRYDLQYYGKNDTTTKYFEKKKIGVRGETSSGLLEPFERLAVTVPQLLNTRDRVQFPSDTISGVDSVDVTMKVRLLSSDDSLVLKPDFRMNDTLTQKYYLRNFFAYDDGLAEYSGGLLQPGQKAALGFDMLLDMDTLIGFYVYYPPFGVDENQTVTFTIYDDKNGQPGEVYQTVLNRVTNLGLSTFQRVVFKPGILIDHKRFYIGWEQPISGRVIIGLDADNNSIPNMFQNTNGVTWDSVQNIIGSFMIRPIFGLMGSEEDNTSAVPEPLSFSIYPNPNTGTFYIEERFDRLSIYDLTGKEIAFDSERVPNGTRITLHEQNRGLYLLKIGKGPRSKTQKLLVR
jgi:hypothetical protein